MIRLIAADMDGTLLNGRGELPPHVFQAVRMLRKQGVLFAAASGRQYYNLETFLRRCAMRCCFSVKTAR